MPGVTIQELVSEFELDLKAGAGGLSATIRNPRIQKPGLALTGYGLQLDRGRLLTLGATEIEYLSIAEKGQRELATKTVLESEPACIVVTRGLQPPAELARACDDGDVPLLVSNHVSSRFIGAVKQYLEERLAPSTTVHGVLVFVHGLGVLLTGKSGVGKSEAAIDLVVRGHRLIADDVVLVRQLGPSTVVGSGPPMLGHHMEIRGLGVIDVAALFGIASVRESSRIDLVLHLVAWDGRSDGSNDHDRLGVERDVYTVLNEELPLRRIPVSPGRTTATIIEVAARDHLLRLTGRNSAAELETRLASRLAATRNGPQSEVEK